MGESFLIATARPGSAIGLTPQPRGPRPRTGHRARTRPFGGAVGGSWRRPGATGPAGGVAPRCGVCRTQVGAARVGAAARPGRAPWPDHGAAPGTVPAPPHAPGADWAVTGPDPLGAPWREAGSAPPRPSVLWSERVAAGVEGGRRRDARSGDGQRRSRVRHGGGPGCAGPPPSPDGERAGVRVTPEARVFGDEPPALLDGGGVDEPVGRIAGERRRQRDRRGGDGW